ncbi:hypothetical protein Ocin01_09473 [Orchesella cincta]|uniref:Uncharacterized protein n=1 Tax=Orchesella cincta TaxID=48709 RepID=A0A1D2MVV3_ORCCI|nr:hypothetical protein Ocin01_09473 [Orchesella cincta]
MSVNAVPGIPIPPPQPHSTNTSSSNSFSTCCEVDDGGGIGALSSDDDEFTNNGTVVADDVTFISNPHEYKSNTCKSDKSSKSTMNHKRVSNGLKSYSLKTWYRAIGKSKWSSPLTSLYLTINHGKRKSREDSLDQDGDNGLDLESPHSRHSSTSRYSDDENKISISVEYPETHCTKSIVVVGDDVQVSPSPDCNNNEFKGQGTLTYGKNTLPLNTRTLTLNKSALPVPISNSFAGSNHSLSGSSKNTLSGGSGGKNTLSGGKNTLSGGKNTLSDSKNTLSSGEKNSRTLTLKKGSYTPEKQHDRLRRRSPSKSVLFHRHLPPPPLNSSGNNVHSSNSPSPTNSYEHGGAISPTTHHGAPHGYQRSTSLSSPTQTHDPYKHSSTRHASIDSSDTTGTYHDDGKHSLLQFAMKYFRQDKFNLANALHSNNEQKPSAWTWRTR